VIRGLSKTGISFKNLEQNIQPLGVKLIEKQPEQICNMFFEVSSVPLTLCWANGEPIYSVPHTDAPAELPQSNKVLIEKFTHAITGQAVPFVEITDPTYFFAVVKLEGEAYLIIGPTAPIKHSEADILKFASARKVPEQKCAAYCERLRQIPVFSFRQFLIITSLVNYLFTDQLISPEEILLSRPSFSKNVEKSLTRAMFIARENQVMHTPASFEHYVLQAVSDGNIPKLKQAFRSPVSGSIGRMSNNPIQQEKFTFICFITLVTRAAIAGGLSQELAFSLSDIYCQTVDKLTNISEITKLSMEMSQTKLRR
jgi:hypothetical protein